MKLDIYFKFYLKGANIVQEFDNFSEILKNPQMLNMLSQFIQNQNNNPKNQPEKSDVKNLSAAVSNNGANNSGGFNMQMIANILPLLNNLNNNNFANMLSMLSNNNSQASNMQNMMLLMNLMSQMQKNNQDTQQNAIQNKNKDEMQKNNA